MPGLVEDILEIRKNRKKRAAGMDADVSTGGSTDIAPGDAKGETSPSRRFQRRGLIGDIMEIRDRRKSRSNKRS